ncbi:MAG: 50S ribosomal protein L5 [Candidatus Saccharimonadales bacterium]
MATATKKTAGKPAATQARLKTLYLTEYVPALQKELDIKNINDVPKIEKITLNIGLGRAKDDKKLLEVASNTLQKITGQKPVETVAKLSIASFKLREGNKIGLKVTLRGERMYEFLDRLVNIVLPRLRDFHGVKATAFDRQGNYSIGLTEQSVFPELTFEETTTPHGLQIVLTVRAASPAHSRALLSKFGMPFEKENK